MRHLLRVSLLFVVLSVIVLIGGCSTIAQKPIQRITLPVNVEFVEADPRKVKEHSSSQVINMLYDGLVRIDENGGIAPGLAKNFIIDITKTKYTFTIRDAIWSDGKPITAYDVEASWKNALDPNGLSIHSNLFFFIKNAQKYVRGECSAKELGIRALNDKTLQVRLERPTPFFLELLTVCIFRPSPWSRVNSPVATSSTCINENLVTSGPFRVKSNAKGMTLTLEKNPTYWNADAVRLEQIDIATVTDTQTTAYLFKNKELDWYGHPLASFDVDAFQNAGCEDPVQNCDAHAFFGLQVNTEDPILSNVSIRQALSCAINREAICKHILHGLYLPAYAYLPNTFQLNRDYTNESMTVYDAQNYLQKGLDDLGISLKDIPPIKLVYSAVGTNKQVSEAVQFQIQKNLGIEIQLEAREWKVLLDKVHTGDFQLAAIKGFSSYPDPAYFLHFFESKTAKNNFPRWVNAEYIALLKDFDNEQDSHRRLDLARRLDKIVINEQPVISINYITYFYANNKRLKNVAVSSLGFADFSCAYIDEESE